MHRMYTPPRITDQHWRNLYVRYRHRGHPQALPLSAQQSHQVPVPARGRFCGVFDGVVCLGIHLVGGRGPAYDNTGLFLYCFLHAMSYTCTNARTIQSKTNAIHLNFGSLSQLVLDVLSELDGAYGLLVKSSHYPGELVAAKKGSPLIIGIKDRHVKVWVCVCVSGCEYGWACEALFCWCSSVHCCCCCCSCGVHAGNRMCGSPPLPSCRRWAEQSPMAPTGVVSLSVIWQAMQAPSLSTPSGAHACLFLCRLQIRLLLCWAHYKHMIMCV